MVVGSSGDAMEVGGHCRWWWVEKETCMHLFVHDVHVSFWQMPLMQLRGHISKITICLSAFIPFFTCSKLKSEKAEKLSSVRKVYVKEL